MSKAEMAIIKAGAMKSYIWLQTADGSIQQVEEEVANFCPMIYHEVLKSGMGSSKAHAISLPECVNPAILSLILDYCRFHQMPGRSYKERKSFNEKVVRIDTDRLCDLASAAHSLHLKPLVDLTCRALARIMEGRTPEEIREIFHIPDDLTEEEKLEPFKNITDDVRIRLLNQLNAKKLKELKERQKGKNVEVEKEPVDERSVDDLVSFINGGSEDSKRANPPKDKKKNRKKKDQLKVPCSNTTSENHMELEGLSPKNQGAENGNIVVASASRAPMPSDVTSSSYSADFDPDVNNGDELDPALKEELDREVEAFSKILGLSFEERIRSLCRQKKDEFP